MGRHGRYGSVPPVMGFAFSGILQHLLWARVRHGEILAVMASLTRYGLCDPASYAVPVMGKSQFRPGLSTFPFFLLPEFGPSVD